MLGHTIGAAGAIESILTLVGMNRSTILPTINYEFPDPKCDLDYVPNEARIKEHGIAISKFIRFRRPECMSLHRKISWIAASEVLFQEINMSYRS